MLRINRLMIERRRAENELAESELRFRNLLGEMTSVAVQGCAPDLRVIFWNKASEILFGYTSEEALDQSLTDLTTPPEIVANLRNDVAQMLDGRASMPTEELSLRRKDGSCVDVISSPAVVKIPGKSSQLYFICVDISHRKQVEKELETYREHLEELLRFAPINLPKPKRRPNPPTAQKAPSWPT